MGRSLLAVLAAALVLVPGALGRPAGADRAAAPPGPTLVFTGRGWGHGVGMSQYGARGFAQRGASYSDILAHYYRGTTLGRAPVARVRVLLAEDARRLVVSSAAPLRVRDAAGEVRELVAGAHLLGPGPRVIRDGAPPLRLSGPLVFLPGPEPLALGGRRYRGTIEVSSAAGRLSAVNSIGLDAYLLGVVPDEMPPDWPEEALKAQAVVARSYALAVRRGGPFDLYADVRSQVYGGVDSEEPATTAAVRATAGEVLLYGGRPATTFFFSTSGGRTAAVTDVFAGAEPAPYLVSVTDPYEREAGSPYTRWGPVAVPGRALARALGLRGGLLDVRTLLAPSGRVASLVGIGPEREASLSGADVRTALGLRSSWFRVGVLGLDPVEGPVPYGSKTPVTGVARGVGEAVLERRIASGEWVVVSPVQPGPDGRFEVPVAADASARYRLASDEVRSAAVRIPVAPRIRLRAAAGAVGLEGTVRPLLPGAEVVLERLAGDRWEPVASALVDEGGAFRADVALAPGAYRARLAPGRGLAAGVSASLGVGP